MTPREIFYVAITAVLCLAVVAASCWVARKYPMGPGPAVEVGR